MHINPSCSQSISFTFEDVFTKSNSGPQLVQFTHGWQVQFLAQGLTFIQNKLGGGWSILSCDSLKGVWCKSCFVERAHIRPWKWAISKMAFMTSSTVKPLVTRWRYSSMTLLYWAPAMKQKLRQASRRSQKTLPGAAASTRPALLQYIPLSSLPGDHLWNGNKSQPHCLWLCYPLSTK